MFPESKVTEIYCMADDFCKEFTLQQEKYMIKDMKTMHRNKPNRMSDAEIMVILILFHSGGFRCFKHYYKEYVCKHLKHLFPRQVSYNRFVELEEEVLLPMTIFIKKVLLGTCTGISFVDSTPLRVCRNQRILIHKTFEGLAERGKCSMGWFFGFKLHLIINDRGEILNFMFTPGNMDDREPLKQGKFRFSRFFVGIIFYLREVLLTLHYEKRLFEHASKPRVAGSDIRLLSHLWSRTNLSRDSYQSG